MKERNCMYGFSCAVGHFADGKDISRIWNELVIDKRKRGKGIGKNTVGKVREEEGESGGVREREGCGGGVRGWRLWF